MNMKYCFCCKLFSQGKTEAALQNGLNDEIDLLLTDSPACHDEIPQAPQVDLLTSEPEEPAVRSSDVENIGQSGGKTEQANTFTRILFQTLTWRTLL